MGPAESPTRWPVVGAALGATLLIHGGAWALRELADEPRAKPVCPTQKEMCVLRCDWDREPEVPVGCDDRRPCSCELVAVESPSIEALSMIAPPPIEAVEPDPPPPPPPPEPPGTELVPETAPAAEEVGRLAAEGDRAAEAARSVSIARVLGTYGDASEGTVFDVIESTENDLGDLFAQGMVATHEAVPGESGDAEIVAEIRAAGGGKISDVDAGPPTTRGSAVSLDIAVTLDTDTDAAVVRKTVAARAKQLRVCYERELKTDPALAGSIAVTLHIADGRVTSVVVNPTGLQSDTLFTCVKAQAARWRFAAEGENEVSFSVVFAAE